MKRGESEKKKQKESMCDGCVLGVCVYMCDGCVMGVCVCVMGVCV